MEIGQPVRSQGAKIVAELAAKAQAKGVKLHLPVTTCAATAFPRSLTTPSSSGARHHRHSRRWLVSMSPKSVALFNEASAGRARYLERPPGVF